MTKLYDLTVIMTHLQELFPSVSSKSVEGLSQDEIFQAFFRLMASQKIAVLKLEYPSEDDKDRDALTAALNAHGMDQTANLIAENTPFIVTEDLDQANRALQVIKQHLPAVKMTFYYQGLSGAAAETELLKEIKNQAVTA